MVSPLERFEVREVAQRVFAALARPGSGAGSNAGIVDLGGAALVVDAMMTPAAGDELRKAAEALTGAKVRYLVLTHRDYDHVMGSQAFPDAVVVATRVTDAVMRQRIEGVLRSSASERAELLKNSLRLVETAKDEALRRERAGFHRDFQALVEAHGLLAPRYAEVRFEGALSIVGSRRTIELIECGALHTESDAVAFLPEEGVLFSGDLVQIQNRLAVRVGGPEGWDAVLEPLGALDVRTVVPGHGPVGDAGAIALTRRYLANLERMAQDGGLDEPFRRWGASDVWRRNARYVSHASRA